MSTSMDDLNIDKIENVINKQRKAAEEAADNTVLGHYMGLAVNRNFIIEGLKIMVEVVWARLKGDISFKPIKYSSSPLNKPIDLTGLLIIPKEGNTKRIPILCYQHGTQMYRKHAPSDFNMLDMVNFYDVFFAALFAKRSHYAVLMPDYPGLGGKSTAMVQPFMVVEPFVRSVVDMLDHVIENFNDKKGKQGTFLWNKQLFLVGYSQGGFVTLSTARELKQKRSYVVTACAPMAGPHELYEVQMKKKFLTYEDIPTGHLLTMIIRGYHEAYKDNNTNISSKLTREAMRYDPKNNIHCERLWDRADGNHVEDEINKSKEMQHPQVRQLSDSTIEMLNKSEEKSGVVKEMKRNNSYQLWPNETHDDYESHINLIHADSDEIVPLKNSELAQETLAKQGYDITLTNINPLEGPDSITVHARAAIPAVYNAIDYFKKFTECTE